MSFNVTVTWQFYDIDVDKKISNTNKLCCHQLPLMGRPKIPLPKKKIVAGNCSIFISKNLFGKL